MLYSSRAIVLNAVRYSDNSLIVNMLTRKFGRAAYVFHCSYSKRGGNRAAFLQPLNILEVEAFSNPKKTVQHLKEIRVAVPFCSIPLNAEKTAIAIFVAEILQKSLRHTEQDENMFDFIENSLLFLDSVEKNFADFHLLFMMRLTQFLGFEPSTNFLKHKYFDMQGGEFTARHPQHENVLEGAVTEHFNTLAGSSFDLLADLHFSRSVRAAMLETMLDYYRIHVPDFQSIKSLSVLQAVFD